MDINGFHVGIDELTKENSLYYYLLVKQEGKKKADFIWNNRGKEDSIWEEVKDYKPKDKLNLIGDLNWGFSSINKDK